MNQIFNPDNFVFRLISRLVDLVGLSLLWTALSLPLVTAVPATAALYHALYRVFRSKDDDRAFLLFFRSFRENLKQGVPASLICLAVGWVLYIIYQWLFYAAPLDADAVVLFVCFYVLLLIPLGTLCWLCPLLGRFSFSLGGLFSTALKLVFAHLPSTLVMVLLTMELASAVPQYLWVPLLIAPAAWALLTSLFTERAFARHMPPQTTASD